MATSKQTYIHTYIHVLQYSPASEGLAQACPKYTECKLKNKNGVRLGMRLPKYGNELESQITFKLQDSCTQSNYKARRSNEHHVSA